MPKAVDFLGRKSLVLTGEFSTYFSSLANPQVSAVRDKAAHCAKLLERICMQKQGITASAPLPALQQFRPAKTSGSILLDAQGDLAN